MGTNMHRATAAACSMLVVAAFVASCGSAATQAPTASAEPTSAASPTTAPPSATPTAATNEVTPAPTPAASAAVDKVRDYVRACSRVTSGYAVAVIIVTVKNTGNTWVRLEPGETDYTVYDANGNVTTTRTFLYAYPKYLAPGETGYLADGAVVDGAKAAEFKRVESDGRYTKVDASDAVVLTASKIKIRKESYGNGRIATGLVTNKSSQNVEQAHAGAFFLDAKGQAIGFSSTNLIENLGAGKTKGFETVTTDCPVNWSLVKKTVVLIGDDNF